MSEIKGMLFDARKTLYPEDITHKEVLRHISQGLSQKGGRVQGGRMKTLTLALKKQWFDKIKSGEKKEEYRECSEYWITRFSKLCGFFEYKFVDHHRKMISCDRLNCDRLVFTLGYPKAGDTERRLCFKNPRIRIGTGRPEWGAKPGKQYFVITWEE